MNLHPEQLVFLKHKRDSHLPGFMGFLLSYRTGLNKKLQQKDLRDTLPWLLTT